MLDDERDRVAALLGYGALLPFNILGNSTAGVLYTDASAGVSWLSVTDLVTALDTAGLATDAELAAHLSDTVDAHDASAISYVGGTGMSATDVESAIDELANEKADTASAVMDGDAAGGVLSGTYPNPGFASDMATQAELDAHLNDTSDAHDASAISYVGGTGMSATDVEAAIDELADEKANLASPTFTGTPAAPTAAVDTNTTQIATTAFVVAQVADDAIIKTFVNAKGDLISATADNTPSIVTVGADGKVLYAGSGATSGLNYGYPQDIGEHARMRAQGWPCLAQAYSIWEATTSSAMVDGTVYFIPVYIPTAMTLTGAMWAQAVQGTSTMVTQKVGLYTNDGTSLNRVATSTSSTSGYFKSAAGAVQSNAFTSTYAATPGIYYVALFADWSVAGTAPSLAQRAAHGYTFSLNAGEAVSGYSLTGQTDLDASELISGMSALATPRWAGVY